MNICNSSVDKTYYTLKKEPIHLDSDAIKGLLFPNTN